jgi:hypothetical protein
VQGLREVRGARREGFNRSIPAASRDDDHIDACDRSWTTAGSRGSASTVAPVDIAPRGAA